MNPISQTLIAFYIQRLTLDEGIALSKKQGVHFTREEGEIILPFLKKYRYNVNLENKEKLLAMIKPKVSFTTYNKIIQLLSRFK